MSAAEKSGNSYVGYEYKEIKASGERASLLIDGYLSFGWIENENNRADGEKDMIRLKRDRKIMNKAELTRLQRHFEACVNEIDELEKSKDSMAIMVSIMIGIIGCAFMAGSVFAVTHVPPMIVLCIALAIPGFLGWILPILIYKYMVKKRTEKIIPMIEQKYDEIHEICEKGSRLLG